MIYLYVKTHLVTGLKYLGQTISKNPQTYTGSGKLWKKHLKDYGSEYTTEILFESESRSEVREQASYYSHLWNIVKSSDWANLAFEHGGSDRDLVTGDFGLLYEQEKSIRFEPTNNKIIEYLTTNVKSAFNLDRWTSIVDMIDSNIVVSSLPWTPVRFAKFKKDLSDTFSLTEADATSLNFDLSIESLSKAIDYLYSKRFWSTIWQPKTDTYQYTGWNIVDEVLKDAPGAVLDVGCGYNQFKQRIPNLTGIDKFNDQADYMVDLLEYNVGSSVYDAVIVFGSINFGEYEDISLRFKKVFDLTAYGGKVFVRANPGEVHKNGPWISIYPWDFDTAIRIAKEHNVKLTTMKTDGSRLYFVYEKSNG